MRKVKFSPEFWATCAQKYMKEKNHFSLSADSTQFFVSLYSVSVNFFFAILSISHMWKVKIKLKRFFSVCHAPPLIEICATPEAKTINLGS
jgi:hypothetical protein